MNRLIALLIALSAGCTLPVAAQQPVENSADTLRSICSTYAPWQSVELSGKVRMAGLPLSPSVKIFMLRGARIDVLVSAPFLGEVAHATLTRDSVQIVNRMKRVYCQEAVSHLTREFPMAISDFQDLLLGRVFELSRGTLREETLEDFSVYQGEENGSDALYVIPAMFASMPTLEYGFTLEASTLQMLQFVARAMGAELGATFTRDGTGSTSISFRASVSGRYYAAALDLGAPKWNAVPFRRTPIDGSFRRVGIQEVMKFS